MEKSGMIIRKFIGYLFACVLFGVLIRGGAFNELPWHIYGPGALIFTLFDVYIRPRLKKKKEE